MFQSKAVRANAYHEAAHAVFAFRFGWGVHSVTIVPDEDTLGSAFLDPHRGVKTDLLMHCFHHMMVLMAGTLAERSVYRHRRVGHAKGDTRQWSAFAYEYISRSVDYQLWRLTSHECVFDLEEQRPQMGDRHWTQVHDRWITSRQFMDSLYPHLTAGKPPFSDDEGYDRWISKHVKRVIFSCWRETTRFLAVPDVRDDINAVASALLEHDVLDSDVLRGILRNSAPFTNVKRFHIEPIPPSLLNALGLRRIREEQRQAQRNARRALCRHKRRRERTYKTKA